MSVNVFDRARSSAGKDAEIVDVKSIQMAYTASGDGQRFFEFALNDDYANLFFRVDPSDVALLAQIGSAVTALGQNRRIQALVQGQELTTLICW